MSEAFRPSRLMLFDIALDQIVARGNDLQELIENSKKFELSHEAGELLYNGVVINRYEKLLFTKEEMTCRAISDAFAYLRKHRNFRIYRVVYSTTEVL